ncbi:MAG: hypothetical protein QF717_13680 [SAR202 cluster bacterium]|jgi:rhodanese-related sulfurtransferase|nr:hypothetical protein [SAR202 cluster bacterium]
MDEEREGTVADLLGRSDSDAIFVSVSELNVKSASSNPPIVLDVRSRANYEADGQQIPGSFRVLPDQVTDWAVDQSLDREVVAYCD